MPPDIDLRDVVIVMTECDMLILGDSTWGGRDWTVIDQQEDTHTHTHTYIHAYTHFVHTLLFLFTMPKQEMG